MPFIDIVSKSDHVSLWYITNAPHNTIGAFDPSKPTILMLHPFMLDSSWLSMHMQDPRLDTKYNIVAFDMRSCGLSRCRSSGAHDSWVDAADLAMAHSLLGLPPVHIFAVEGLSTNTAIRLAALFPDMCLSLTLVNVPPPTELKDVFETYGEMLNMWCYPTDIEEFEHACLMLLEFALGEDVTPDLQDELIGYWSQTFPPWKRSRMYETMHCVLNRTPIPQQVLASVTQPTLIIQSDKTKVNPVKYADRLASDLKNVRGGARVHIIRGSPELLSVIPSCASIVNRVFAEFLSRQPPSTSQISALDPQAREERWRAALGRLSEFVGDEGIKAKDACCPLSFSCVGTEVGSSQEEVLRRHAIGEEGALSPLGYDGRPLRKYSERQDGHWFQEDETVVEKHSSTILLNQTQTDAKLKAFENLVLQTEYNATKTHLPSYTTSAEPVSLEVARTGRMQRTNVSKHVVEKATIGGGAAGSAFAPALIAGTLQMSRSTRMRF